MSVGSDDIAVAGPPPAMAVGVTPDGSETRNGTVLHGNLGLAAGCLSGAAHKPGSRCRH